MRPPRLRARTLVALAIISGLAVAVVIHVGTRRSSAETAALAALRSAPGTVHNLQALAGASGQATPGRTVTVVEAPTPASGGSSDASAGSSDAGDTSSPSTSASAPTPTQTTTTQASTTTAASTTTTPTNAGLPKVGHVFVLELSDSSYAQAFGPNSAAPYLRSLVSQGALLSNYRSLGHGALADTLATTIGQPPNADTTKGCGTFTSFRSGAQPNSAGVLSGAGCLYPDSVASLADAVGTSGRRWSAFVEGLDQSECASPQVDGPLNAKLQGVSGTYDPTHNPFIFFQSLVEAGGCASSDVDVTKLANELKTASLTPTYNYIAPGACGNGALAPVRTSPAATLTGTTTSATPGTSTGTTAAGAGTATTGANGTATTATTGTSTATTGTATTGTATGIGTTPTTTGTGTTATLTTPTAPAGAVSTGVCPAGATAGIPAEDAFLNTWVPQILASPAYQANGVLVIAFNGTSPAHGTAPFSTGALVLSRWTKPGQVLGAHYSPYSLLQSVEDMLDLQPLGKSAGAGAFAKHDKTRQRPGRLLTCAGRVWSHLCA